MRGSTLTRSNNCEPQARFSGGGDVLRSAAVSAANRGAIPGPRRLGAGLTWLRLRAKPSVGLRSAPAGDERNDLGEEERQNVFFVQFGDSGALADGTFR